MKLLLVLVTALTLSSVFAAEEVPQITVQGKCDIKVAPDRGTITFSAENQSKDQKEAVKKTNNQINKLKDKIKSLGLNDLELKNTQYNVFPVREYEKEHYVDKGIRASLTLEVTTSDITRLGEAMMEASKVGIQNIGALMTFLSVTKSQNEYLKCLDIAAADARKKADQLAKKLNFKLGSVIKLNESPAVSIPAPMHFERSMMKGATAGSAPTQIEAGEQAFSTNIQVTFSIK